MIDDNEGVGVVDHGTLDPKLKDLVDEQTRPEEGFLFCADCSHVIGHVQDRIEVNGAFQHTCTNPYGYVHRFGCHSDALGCAISGSVHSADSWFKGYVWQLASCGGCGQHMGWLFERSGGYFYGLILERIQAG